MKFSEYIFTCSHIKLMWNCKLYEIYTDCGCNSDNRNLKGQREQQLSPGVVVTACSACQRFAMASLYACFSFCPGIVVTARSACQRFAMASLYAC